MLRPGCWRRGGEQVYLRLRLALLGFKRGESMAGIDALLDKARFSSSSKEQMQLWAEAQRKIATDVAAIPLYSVKYVLARNKRVDLTFEQPGNVFYDFSVATRLLRRGVIICVMRTSSRIRLRGSGRSTRASARSRCW